MIYRKATSEDLSKIWDKDILANAGDERYKKWKEQYVKNNKSGASSTFVCVDGDDPVGQITVLYSTECSAVKGRPLLCDGQTRANMNAFRIEKAYEGQGHISKLVRLAEDEARSKGVKTLTIGSEAKESRNLAIYLHFGYTNFVTYLIEDDELIVFYSKDI